MRQIPASRRQFQRLRPRSAPKQWLRWWRGRRPPTPRSPPPFRPCSLAGLASIGLASVVSPFSKTVSVFCASPDRSGAVEENEAASAKRSLLLEEASGAGEISVPGSASGSGRPTAISGAATRAAFGSAVSSAAMASATSGVSGSSAASGADEVSVSRTATGADSAGTWEGMPAPSPWASSSPLENAGGDHLPGRRSVALPFSAVEAFRVTVSLLTGTGATFSLPSGVPSSPIGSTSPTARRGVALQPDVHESGVHPRNDIGDAAFIQAADDALGALDVQFHKFVVFYDRDTCFALADIHDNIFCHRFNYRKIKIREN